ncbi:GAF domain-containing protein [Parvularcula sp. ZS-1/3]|uniref:GAF domain-containing protein n=1 Tax=Parvularcula mediterranea TaxID=2732508 RepID=A0A7Y3W639_9PROT|nr:GAF domain-containing protein [Parvularcula mediterranea]NNU16896.1 GAF domain-containing protein [Parvularcula mediterranea]
MTKADIYAQTAKEIAAVLEGEPNLTARMATVSCLLAQAFPGNIWTGFYIVDPDKPQELVVGPYQGTLGCLRIPFGKGVCGAAAATLESQVVEDVHEFEGHIACDSRSVSEVVVPVRTKSGQLMAVLDIDSPDKGTFDRTDAEWLERIIEETFAN